MQNSRPTIRLLTYNLFLRPPPIKTNADDFKNQRFEAIKQLLPSYDILCFQELFSTGNFRKEAMIEHAIHSGYFYWAISQPPSFYTGPPVDGGLAVISRYPILEQRFESYKIGVLSDSASDKGSLYCKIQIQDATLHLFNTHLQATYHNADSVQPRKLTIMTRLHQFSILVDRIEEILNSEDYSERDLIVLAGDLNTDARKTYHDLSFTDVGAFASRFGLGTGAFNEYDVMKQILRNGGKNRVIDFAFEKHKEHPVTFGETECVLTGQEDINSRQRLDYIIQITRDNHKNECLVPHTASCQVQKHEINGQPFTQLSDHYGLSIEIEHQMRD